MEIRNERGQTVVEYILLLVVAISLVITFFNSEAFRRLFGSQGAVGQRIKKESEFSYRHAYGVDYREGGKNIPSDIDRNNRDISSHPSYADPIHGGTRFFGPKDPYQ